MRAGKSGRGVYLTGPPVPDTEQRREATTGAVWISRTKGKQTRLISVPTQGQLVLTQS